MNASEMPSDNELQAFVDQELDAARRAEVARALEDNPALAARAGGFRRDRDALRAAVSALAEGPVPAAWIRQIETATRETPRVTPTRRFALAAGICAVVGAAGLAAWRWPQSDTILGEAEAAREDRTPATGSVGDELPSPVATDALLKAKLAMPVKAPDLQRFGFHLARLDWFGATAGGAAQLEYRDDAQRLLTIYVRRSDGTARFDLLKRGENRVCVWQDDVVGAVIIAPASAGEMMRIASAAYSDLNL